MVTVQNPLYRINDIAKFIAFSVRMSPFLIHLLQLALGQIRDHFEAVYDLTIIYEGLTSGGRVRNPPPNLFGKSTKLL